MVSASASDKNYIFREMKGDIKKVASPRRYEVGANSYCWLGMAKETDGIHQSCQSCWWHTSGQYTVRLRGGFAESDKTTRNVINKL